MRRVVYCPYEYQIKQAENIAKKNNLPINIGMFDGLKNFEILPTIPCVLEIPENKEIIFDNNIKQYFHQNIVYYNDFIKFNKNLLLFINDILYNSILMEKHKSVYNIYESTVGSKICKIYYNNKIIESFEYNVY